VPAAADLVWAMTGPAGFGVGTLYRHFPTKEALIGVLVQEHLDRLTVSAEMAVQADDPWQAVEGLIWALATFEADDRGMLDILTHSAPQSECAEAALGALVARLDRAVVRAQAAGQMRGDVSAQDVLLLVCGVGKMVMASSDTDEGRWQRLIAVTLNGLRAPRPRPRSVPSR
jgi:AcrR family transcriptional regulator